MIWDTQGDQDFYRREVRIRRAPASDTNIYLTIVFYVYNHIYQVQPIIRITFENMLSAQGEMGSEFLLQWELCVDGHWCIIGKRVFTHNEIVEILWDFPRNIDPLECDDTERYGW